MMIVFVVVIVMLTKMWMSVICFHHLAMPMKVILMQVWMI